MREASLGRNTEDAFEKSPGWLGVARMVDRATRGREQALQMTDAERTRFVLVTGERLREVDELFPVSSFARGS